MKTCIRCHKTKPISGFSRDRGRSDGHRGDCRSCRAVVERGRYLENRDAYIARAKKQDPAYKRMVAKRHYYANKEHHAAYCLKKRASAVMAEWCEHSPGFVYVVRERGHDHFVGLGFTCSEARIPGRLLSYNGHNPREMYFSSVTQHDKAKLLERAIHMGCFHWQLKNRVEWYPDSGLPAEIARLLDQENIEAVQPLVMAGLEFMAETGTRPRPAEAL